MAAPTEREERAIQRAVGVDAYNLWKTLLGSNEETGYAVHLQDMWEDQAGSVKLVAADILVSLADPSNEQRVKIENRGDVDTKGQMQAWLGKASQLRAEASSESQSAAGPQFSDWVGDECAEGSVW